MPKNNSHLIELKPGSLSAPHFDLLVSLTSLRSQETIDALRSHLVDGLTKSQAYTLHGVDKTIFGRRLVVLREVNDIVERIKALDQVSR